MKQLNRAGAEIMQKYNVTCATDITGFGLLGHAMHIARASGISLEFNAARLPGLSGARALIDLGCIPGGAFRNQKYVEAATSFDSCLSYTDRMLSLDPQTSGGLLMLVDPELADQVSTDLLSAGYTAATTVGRSLPRQEKLLYLR